MREREKATGGKATPRKRGNRSWKRNGDRTVKTEIGEVGRAESERETERRRGNVDEAKWNG